jgi:SagB-type dehydrogenase family enzyme
VSIDAPSTPTVCEELFALRRGVSSAALPDGGLHLVAWPHAEPVGRLTPDQHAVLRALAGRPHTRAELEVPGAGHDGEAGSEAVARLLDRLRAGGWLKTTVAQGGRPLYTLDPLHPPPPPPPPWDADAALVLSRFAVLHRDDGGLVLESPRAWCDIRVHDPAVLGVVLGRLADLRAGTTGSPAGSEAGAGAGAGEAGRRLIHDLRWSGMAVPDGAEDGELRLRQWSPHELWFHNRSRIGYRGFLGDGFAATHWAKGRFDPPPARPEPFPGPTVDLHRPDLDALRRTDPPLTAVIEERRSLRFQDEDNPVTATQLGEFLYRCARTLEVGSYGGQDGQERQNGLELTRRPYPSGGGAYELEVYPVVRHAVGLAPGMYHYDSHAHRLRLVRPVSHPAVRHLLRGSAALGPQPSQVLLVVSARPGRLMWKYEAIGYALVLKHLGVLYQTMYLVATAMGLAPCAIGAGDAVAFTEATGRDPLAECGVGEFALGSMGKPGPQPR